MIGLDRLQDRDTGDVSFLTRRLFFKWRSPILLKILQE